MTGFLAVKNSSKKAIVNFDNSKTILSLFENKLTKTKT